MSVYPQQYVFAAGSLIATQTNTSGAVTPVRFGILQDVSVDFSADLKELYGQNRYAIALAPGKTKVEIKAKFAQISANLFNSVYFGSTISTTQTLLADGEIGTIMSGGSLTVSNAATFLADEGIVYNTTQVPLVNVGTITATGQYKSAGAGIYNFNTADIGSLVAVSYLYSATGGDMIPMGNPKMGVGPSFKVVLSQQFDNRALTYVFNNCQAAKLSMPAKQDDWLISEIDFQVSADTSGNIGSISSNL